MKKNFFRWLLFVYCLTQAAANADWTARPLEVHEWGVSEYDWSRGRTPPADLADFIYTDRKPGNVAAKPKERVKDSEADGGMRIRTKPILYFYGPNTLQKKPQRGLPIPVGVEARFQDGHANAWWPQVNLYRSPEQAAKAVAPDVEAWDQSRMELLRRQLKSRLISADFEKVWRRYENQKFIPNTQGSPRKDFNFRPPFPDDERFQLVWDRLELSQEIPPGKHLQGESLPETHWLKIARRVESDHVSNGSEVERFLFYEGKTRETPAIAIVPHDPFMTGAHFLVCNINDFPIYDLFLIYRDRRQGKFWVRYTPEVAPLRKRQFGNAVASQQSLPHLVSPAIPRFEDLRPDDMVEENEFHRRTQLRLGNVLRMDFPDPGAIYTELRNPAQYQPPTQEFRLFPKEIAALLGIWNEEFFGNDGLTILYRESPAYLDHAAPLRIFTDMHHYVNLSRCSLVVSRNIDLARISEIAKVLNPVLATPKADAEKFDATAQFTIWECFRKDRFGTLGLLEHRRRSGSLEKALSALLNEMKASLNPK